MKRLWLVFAQSVTVLLAALFVVATLKPEWLNRKPTFASVVPVLEAPAPRNALPATNSFSAAARAASPAVVSINTSKAAEAGSQNADPWFRFFFGEQGKAQPQAGLGSGVIVSPAGYILTNNHVIEEADQIEVILNDGRKSAAQVIGTDPETDLAILKVNLKDLPVITLGDSDALAIGDQVLAIGNPFGVGQTVTSGIVSALGRTQLGINTFENFIQTDAAINPGNSGGALVDTNGHLMGINTAIYSRSGGSMGIGFAIPTSTARSVLDAIVRDGQVTRGWIGVEPQDLTPELAESFGLASGTGVIITGVLQNGPAAQAGIRPGDVIVGVAGRNVTNVAQLLSAVASLQPGTPATLDVVRKDGKSSVDVTPGKRTPPPRQVE
ncbi:MAG: 2-alkenal reductase [Burkholderiales bacterium RIFCSPHIGHO2_02_FULL_66_10]|jgi:Do/DeqQ family serine protease|uniref:S1C family serine protease n=1 Tax=Hydrogenophaga sp. TaxID=1904254 RepID=UPI0008D381CD|nr:Do family serine endopeptidase [Hydrogenophaga sp.]MBU4184585.1 Do family serine endopeptidase [Gammaproteobacteria bacterium]MBW8468902.1 Do family serine endopeptidase [Thiobacillus sp.]OGB26988.1 MAG: 2-alkenal reductase [Burkholderiales bacterium RIFCSPHIGHO2_02_FULL_66_10]OGB34361.1 MAG: 2-alkenal reductase [Burkholderiales bacterium RIFCSPLOWO2_02_FULL_66_35]PKO76981.1 MAG: 2-alkenal reductase [Betaproteobacteria bacterium HGW-Betaproteobacteria-15]